MLKAVLWSVIGGVVGTLIGALFAVLFGDREALKKYMPAFMGLTAGIMLVILFCDMIPESIEQSGIFVCVGVTAAGCGAVWLLSMLLTRKHGHNHSISDSIEEHGCNDDGARIHCRRAGIVFAIALMLHNFPEGMAMGSMADSQNTAVLAVSVAWHNIPEGMALALWLYKGGLGKIKPVLAATAVGAVTVVGSVIGYAVSGISAMFSGICIALSAGALLYVIFGDMLSDAYRAGSGKGAAVSTAVGIVGALLIIGVM